MGAGRWRSQPRPADAYHKSVPKRKTLGHRLAEASRALEEIKCAAADDAVIEQAVIEPMLLSRTPLSSMLLSSTPLHARLLLGHA